MADLELMNPHGFTVQYGFPAYRVFIFGQEVTCDVTAVTINWHDGLQPGTCNVTLANKNFRYTVTHNDMLQIAAYRKVPKASLEKLVDQTLPESLQVPASQILANSENIYTAYNPIGDDDVAHDPTGQFRSIKQNIVNQKLMAGGSLIPIVPGYEPVNPTELASPTEFWNSAIARQNALAQSGEMVTYGQKPTDMPAVAWRYPFQVGKPIFHPYDPIRVFERDPFDPNIWYYMFSGFCSDFSISRTTQGDSVLTVVAEQPSKLLRYGRFTSNPGIVDVGQVSIREAIVADVTLRTAFKSAFARSTLPQIMYGVLFGLNAFGRPQGQTGPINFNNSLDPTDYTQTFNTSFTPDNLRQAANLPSSNPGELLTRSSQIIETPDMVTETMWCANGSTEVSRRKWGVGHIKLTGSKVFLYGPTTTGTTIGSAPSNPQDGVPLALGTPEIITELETYQDYITHEVQFSDYTTMRADGISTTDVFPPQPTSISDIITLIGSRPDLYPVDASRMIMLLPRSFGGENDAVTTREFIQSFALNTEWTTRQDVLAEIVERIEFVWYVSPKGDYIIEFPLYDFSPEDFGAYQGYWDLPLPNTLNIDATMADNKVYTQTVVVPSIIQNMESMTPVSKQMGRQAVVTLWNLIPIYGVRGVAVNPRGYLNSLPAARVYGHLCLNRLNSDAFTTTVGIIPNLNMWINRPVMVNMIDHIGTVRTLTHNITWGMSGDMSTTLGLAYMRGWDGALDVGDPNNPKKVYYTIGGVMGRPLNYKLMFTPNPPVAQTLPSGETTR